METNIDKSNHTDQSGPFCFIQAVAHYFITQHGVHKRNTRPWILF